MSQWHLRELQELIQSLGVNPETADNNLNSPLTVPYGSNPFKARKTIFFYAYKVPLCSGH